ncbi:integrase core domain-containing protein [Xanthomonas phaseoli]|nr:integrase core domain-containing protein [Xanthomonas phaseoli]
MASANGRGDYHWIAFYNQQRPHQALKMMTPDAAYAATLTA